MKKKKRKLLKKKEKIILICVGVLAFMVILGVALMPTKIKNSKETNTTTNEIDRELTSVQEVVEYLESSYISMGDSTESGYELDIKVSFKYDLYESDKSQEIYFKNFYEKIAMVTEFKSFRLIDTTRSITIAVKCSNKKITEVKINGETDYFKKEESRRSKNNILDIDTIELSIDSQILKSLINANWNTANVELGTAESTYEKYQIYFDEGYEIRTIQGKVYNIVFNEKYTNKVIDGYKVGDNLEKIEAALGTSYKESGIIGYKTKDFYVYFTSDEISIYPNYRYDYTEFEKLVEEYNEKKDVNDFMDKLTDIWPDYDQYKYDTNYVEICYTLKGVRIAFNSYEKEGIQIYENYKGDIKTEQPEYDDLYYILDESLIVQSEGKRKILSGMYDNSNMEQYPLLYSEEFFIKTTKDGDFHKKIKIDSITGEYPNNELDDTIVIYKYVWADNYHLIYSIMNKGIYLYNARTRETELLISGEDQFEITDYDRNTNILTYDDKQVIINYE